MMTANGKSLGADARVVDVHAISRRSAMRVVVMGAVGVGLMACTDEEAPVSDAAVAGKTDAGAAGSGVTGKVTDAAGKPVVGAMIAAEPLAGTSVMLPEIAVMTGADGGYSWPLPAGKFKLSVMVDGAAKASVEVESVAGKATTADIAVK